VLRIAPDRGKQHLHGLIGDGFAGVVGSDRFSAYNSLEPERRQVCWSHLRRDFSFHADLGLGAQETFGLDGLEVTWNAWDSEIRSPRKCARSDPTSQSSRRPGGAEPADGQPLSYSA
jgi:Transposase IS66 family